MYICKIKRLCNIVSLPFKLNKHSAFCRVFCHFLMFDTTRCVWAASWFDCKDLAMITDLKTKAATMSKRFLKQTLQADKQTPLKKQIALFVCQKDLPYDYWTSSRRTFVYANKCFQPSCGTGSFKVKLWHCVSDERDKRFCIERSMLGPQCVVPP